MTLDDGFVLHISVNDINWYRLMVVNFIDRLQKVKILLIASEAVVSGCVCVCIPLRSDVTETTVYI